MLCARQGNGLVLFYGLTVLSFALNADARVGATADFRGCIQCDHSKPAAAAASQTYQANVEKYSTQHPKNHFVLSYIAVSCTTSPSIRSVSSFIMMETRRDKRL